MRNRMVIMALAALGLTGFAVVAADDSQDTVPDAYLPFEHMIGSWKGQGIPAKNAIKGWPEKHMWAWKFAKGKPVGMTLEITGSKIFTKAALSQDPKTQAYTLDGTDPDGKPVKFTGKLEENGILQLDRVNPPAELGKERLVITLNQNKIRYTVRLSRQEPDAPQYAAVLSANLGKEGEAFAAGGAAADVPKCIVTGGAGTLTVTYQGKAFPICCTGCRDEFNENPDKYVKKYLARLEKGEAPAVKTADATTTATPEKKAEAKAMPKEDTPKAKTASKTETTKPAAEKKEDPNAKAASILAQGTALEKSGKTAAALIYYKRVAKEFPDSPSAKTANAKIKALSK